MAPGSPQLNSFGPNMTLAKELLQNNESKAVLDYMEQVQKYWNSAIAKQKIEGWRKQISEGKVPDFEGNLLY